MGDEITKPIDVFEFDQPNLLLIPLMIEWLVWNACFNGGGSGFLRTGFG